MQQGNDEPYLSVNYEQMKIKESRNVYIAWYIKISCNLHHWLFSYSIQYEQMGEPIFICDSDFS